MTLYNLTHIVGSVDASVQQDLPLSLQVIYYVIVALWLSSLIRVLCTRPVCSTVVVLCFGKFYPKTLRIFSRHMHDICIRVYYIHTNTHRQTHTHISKLYIDILCIHHICMCIYIYIYVYIGICMFTYIYIYMYMCVIYRIRMYIIHTCYIYASYMFMYGCTCT